MKRFFFAHVQGRKYYEVIEQGISIFTGTGGECHRFMRLHKNKVAAEMAIELSPYHNRLPKREQHIHFFTAAFR